MHIIHVATEVAPIAKIGGLADVIIGLTRELLANNHQVEIIIPKYDILDIKEIGDLHIQWKGCTTTWKGRHFPLSIWSGQVENITVHFLESELSEHFFQRGTIYGCTDDRHRFLHFSRAVLDFLDQENRFPDIIHLHDWQTAIIAPLFLQKFAQKNRKTKILFTIHNLAYQGKGPEKDLSYIDLSLSECVPPLEIFDDREPNQTNLLKAGIVYADGLTTVSPSYAKEILLPDGSEGLQGTLIKHQHKLVGILNGIDYSYWNPENDRYLSTHYSYREIPQSRNDNKILDNKRYLKTVLCDKVRLAPEPRPLIGCVTRLVPQKGPHLIEHAIEYTLEKGGAFILLGSTTLPEMNQHFYALQQRYASNPYAHIILSHQEDLVHLIFAGCDLFLIPSIYEPCGLTQLIALKYGTIPIVRKTGGLADTILDVDEPLLNENEGNGYLFKDPTEEALEHTLNRALQTWLNDQDLWRKLMIRAMQQDFSWHHSAQYYLDLYQQLHKTKATKIPR